MASPRLLFTKGGLNFRYRILERHMLPDADHCPALMLQQQCLGLVPLGIAAKLRCPVLRIDSRIPAMFGTTMPETSIHKDRYAPTREYDVGPHKPPTDPDGEIFEIPET